MPRPGYHTLRNQFIIQIKPLGNIQINGKTSIDFGQVVSLALDSLQSINSSFKRREKEAGKSQEMGCLPAIGKSTMKPLPFLYPFSKAAGNGGVISLNSWRGRIFQRRLKRLFTDDRNELGMFLFFSGE